MKTKTLTKFKSQVLTLVLTIVALAVGQSAWAQDVTGTGAENDPYVVYSWTQLKEKMAAGGYIRLDANVTDPDKSSSSYLSVPSGVTVTLDLAGHTIDRGLTAPIVYGHVIRIDGNSSSALEIIDSSEGKTGIITGGYNATAGGTSCNASCIFVTGVGHLTLSGGTITGNRGGQGGAVYVNNSTFTMTGGSITNNQVADNKNGGGVLIASNNNVSSTFNMSGGTISGNSAAEGGGVFVSSGTFNMTGGTISGNTATTEGGGVKISGSNGVFTMTGGTITNNSAPKGGGVMLNNGTFNISDTPTIAGNTNGNANTPAANNVYLANGKLITISDALTNAALIGITMEATGVFTSGLSGHGDVSSFVYDDNNYEIALNVDGEAYVNSSDQWKTSGEETYICMPRIGTSIGTIPNNVTTFKVYDNGGPDANYSNKCNGTLVLTAPSNHKIQLTGSVTTLEVYDYLKIYDSDGSTVLLDEFRSRYRGYSKDIETIISSGNSLTLFFHSSDGSLTYDGLNLTATVIDCSNPLAITPAANITGGTFSIKVSDADVTSAVPGTTVTLAGTPSDGNYLNDFIVTGSSHSEEVTGGNWYSNNTGTFRMPNEAVTVTPVFSDIPYIKMPKTGDRTVTLPASMTSVKVYDDGGPNGNYSDNCDGNLILTVPAGHLIYLSGSKTAEDAADPIRVYDGDTESEDNRLCGHGGSLSDVYCNHEVHNKKIGDPIITTGQSIRIKFISNEETNYAGLDLTAKVGHTITAATGLTGGSISADKSFASDGETISLTVTPATGYSIGTVSYNDGSDHVVNAVNDAYSFVIPANTNAYDISVTATFRKLLTNTDITIANIPSQEYTGSALTPVVSISDGTTPLVKNTDFSISTTASCINVGDYEVTITGIGNYDGTENKTFTITPAPVTLTANSDTKEYSGAEQTVSGFTSSVDGLTFAGVTASGSGTNVGTYDVTFSGVTLNATKDDTGNYVVTSTTNGTLTIETAVTDYGAAKIAWDQTGKTATLDGASDLSCNITNQTNVEHAVLNRTFTADKKVTICLPFEVTAEQAATLGKFYYFSNVTGEGKIEMTQVAGTLTAHTPYIFEPGSNRTTFDFGAKTILAGTPSTTSNSDLAFKGIYNRVMWTTATTDALYNADRAAELGKAYGFALENKTVGTKTYEVGQFVKLGDGAHSRAFRAYLLYEGTWDGTQPTSSAPRRSNSSLPNVIEIVWKDADGNVTGISALDTRSGEMTDYGTDWYTVDGRKLNGKPTTKGLYINNGRKVVVK